MNLSLNAFLLQRKVSDDLRHLLTVIARSTKYVGLALEKSDGGKAGTVNLSGDAQLKLDVLADKIIAEHLAESGLVSEFCSEETCKLGKLDAKVAKPFLVLYDPLDGSSLVETNLAVGSVFGVLAGGEALGRSGTEMVAACYAVYGPRTVFVVALPGEVHEFVLNEAGEFHVTRENIKIENEKKICAPGAFKFAAEGKYKELLERWLQEEYTLRYSGGMVPDIHQILSKKGGVFVYPNGKLRLLFECWPMAYIIMQAGGSARIWEGGEVLEVESAEFDQRCSLICGSEGEVEKVFEVFNS